MDRFYFEHWTAKTLQEGKATLYKLLATDSKMEILVCSVSELAMGKNDWTTIRR
jgi:hypothetical protein